MFTGKIPFPGFVNVHVVLMVSRGERPQRPPGGERLGLGSAVWKLTEECWNQNPDRRPDIASVLRRFQDIFSAGRYRFISFTRTYLTGWNQPGEVKPSSPIIERFKSFGLSFDSPQSRINKLDQVSTFNGAVAVPA